MFLPIECFPEEGDRTPLQKGTARWSVPSTIRLSARDAPNDTKGADIIALMLLRMCMGPHGGASRPLCAIPPRVGCRPLRAFFELYLFLILVWLTRFEKFCEIQPILRDKWVNTSVFRDRLILKFPTILWYLISGIWYLKPFPNYIVIFDIWYLIFEAKGAHASIIHFTSYHNTH